MDFEWDPAKEEKNINERDLDFTTASRIWDGPVLETIDDRRDYRETRILAFGKINGRLTAVLFTWRGKTRRIISARKANRREQRRFEADIRNHPAPPPD
jgi:uncharacterized DUF497 family protein